MIHYALIMTSGREAAHDDVVSLLAAKDAEIAALAARVSELEGLVAALHAQLGRDSANSGKRSYSAGVSAGGSHAPVVKSWWRASSLSSPHLVAVSR